MNCRISTIQKCLNCRFSTIFSTIQKNLSDFLYNSKYSTIFLKISQIPSTIQTNVYGGTSSNSNFHVNTRLVAHEYALHDTLFLAADISAKSTANISISYLTVKYLFLLNLSESLSLNPFYSNLIL